MEVSEVLFKEIVVFKIRLLSCEKDCRPCDFHVLPVISETNAAVLTAMSELTPPIAVNVKFLKTAWADTFEDEYTFSRGEAGRSIAHGEIWADGSTNPNSEEQTPAPHLHS